MPVAAPAAFDRAASAGTSFSRTGSASSSASSIDRGVALNTESRRVFYGLTGEPAADGQIRCPEECQLQSRRAMLATVGSSFARAASADDSFSRVGSASSASSIDRGVALHTESRKAMLSSVGSFASWLKPKF